MTLRRAILCAALAVSPALTGPGAAQQGPIDLPAEALFGLGAAAFEGRQDFSDDLVRLLPGLQVRPGGRVATAGDPFLWSFGGTFGGPGASPVPGAIFECARYGLDTRALFAERGFSDPATFALMGDVLPLSDDAEVWPETAVARLHCTFIWDDVETVRILAEPAARSALAAFFDEVSVADDGTRPALRAAGEGFRLRGRNHPAGSTVWIESGDVILTRGHQQVSFRAFVMGGAV